MVLEASGKFSEGVVHPRGELSEISADKLSNSTRLIPQAWKGPPPTPMWEPQPSCSCAV